MSVKASPLGGSPKGDRQRRASRQQGTGIKNHHQDEMERALVDESNKARRRTPLKKIISIRVLCLRTADWTIATATSAGLSVLGMWM
jgi:hypothetical protein